MLGRIVIDPKWLLPPPHFLLVPFLPLRVSRPFFLSLVLPRHHRHHHYPILLVLLGLLVAGVVVNYHYFLLLLPYFSRELGQSVSLFPLLGLKVILV